MAVSGSGLVRAAPWALYAACAGAMAWFRIPWVDEAWVAGPAATLLSEGVMLDVGGPLPDEATRQAPLLELFGLVLAGWFSAFGVEIVRARVLTVITGALFLVVSDRALQAAGTPDRTRTIVRWLFVTSYFFLFTSSWVRPDIAAVTLAFAGGLAVARWSVDGSRRLLALGHSALILATSMHLQAGFVGLAMWVATLGAARRPARGDLLAFLAPYGAALALSAAVYWNRMDAVAHAFARGFSGDIVAHSGGVPGALLRYIDTGRWEAVAGMTLLVCVVAYGPWAFYRDRRTPVSLTVALAAWGAAASWFLTTAVGNNYHAVWITPALVLGAAAAWTPAGALVRWRWPQIAVPALLAIFGLALTAQTVRDDGRSGYEADLTRLDAAYGLRAGTLSGAREIQWHYDFDRKLIRHLADGHRPEWLLVLNTRDAPEGRLRRGGRTYRRVDTGRVLTLYQRD